MWTRTGARKGNMLDFPFRYLDTPQNILIYGGSPLHVGEVILSMPESAFYVSGQMQRPSIDHKENE